MGSKFSVTHLEGIGGLKNRVNIQKFHPKSFVLLPAPQLSGQSLALVLHKDSRSGNILYHTCLDYQIVWALASACPKTVPFCSSQSRNAEEGDSVKIQKPERQICRN